MKNEMRMQELKVLIKDRRTKAKQFGQLVRLVAEPLDRTWISELSSAVLDLESYINEYAELSETLNNE